MKDITRYVLCIVGSIVIYVVLLLLVFIVFDVQKYYLAIFLPCTAILGIVIANLYYLIFKHNKERNKMTKLDVLFDKLFAVFYD